MSSQFHNHSEYSVLDGYSHPEEYMKRAKEIGCKAFAITEHGNQYSWVYFDKLKKDYPEVKMIYGVEAYECFDINVKDKNSKYFHLVLLAKNEKGRIALNEIITISNLQGFYYKPRIDLEHLKPYANDIIVTTGCLASKLAREEDYEKCVGYIREYKSIFPYFYLEMQSHKSEQQCEYNKKILKLAKDTNTEYIITCDSHVAYKEDLYYQGRHVQIAHDSDTMSESYEGCYLQSDEEIHEIVDSQIGKLAVDIALANSDKIADMIDVVNMPFQEPQLPTFPLPEGYVDNYEYIQHLLKLGWKKRNFDNMCEEDIKIRKERMEYELSVIHQMNFDGYFLIVWDFINYCVENDIPTGVGRGSCAGSLVCYLLEITDLDPIKYGLIFERFLNIERISMPDTDTDLSDRQKVIDYLISKYGEDRVCQVINFNFITPIMAIKDSANVLKIPYKIADKISKQFSYETFEECMEKNPNMYEEFKSNSDEEFNTTLNELFNIASHISGRLRNVSIHAGGVGIVDTKITDYMAMKLGEKKGEHIIQVDKKVIEDIGIIKFDILGVATLKVVDDVIKDTGINPFDININNPNFYNDKETYDLLCSGDTNGVFQVSSFEMKNLLKRLQPRTVGELSDLIALFRPDTLNLIEHYINRKHGLEEIKYIHEDMKPILSNTYNCMIYQEQLLDIVRKFGGRTYGGGDKFRKGIGKKDKALVKAEADKLYYEILEQGYTNEIAYDISKDLADKGGYSFNKSHSMSYAVLSLQTAYCKAHYPVEFYKAHLNNVRTKNDKVNKFIVDAQNFGVTILPPDINKSTGIFNICDNLILFGFEAIRGLGENVSNSIIEERNRNGNFKNFDDFLNRVNLGESNIVALIKSGAIPCKNKKEMLIKFAKKEFVYSEFKEVNTLPTLKRLQNEWNIDTDLIKTKEERLKLYNEKKRITHEEYQKEKYKKHMSAFEEKYLQNEEMWEFQTLSTFLNNNPFTDAYDKLQSFEDIEEGDNCTIVGVISSITKKKDKNKNQYAFITLYSATGIMELTIWSRQYSMYQDIIVKDKKVALFVNKREEKGYIQKVKTYEQWLKDVGNKLLK